ncbi:hypothetical protein CDL12_03854 [Handroanthus impetiginosus]|uniref:MORF/ORRM1/DAG-like MORF domain-containing protein n=1 Tax=Handroanthus impetiginosus TaxID=429701 RepID=A0A2G9I0Y7_9LAMI|nr:hypothetical protein CDL12_03854 [Handroanthus impetiginosus]
MAATIARSIVAVRSTGATASLLFPTKRMFSSTISKPPPLPGFGRPGISTIRSVVPALSVINANLSRVNQVRCRVNRSGSAYSPLNSGSNFSDRPPTEMAPLFPGEEEAKKKIYNVSCERYFGFGCEIDEETSNKLEGLPGVLFVLPDSYVDAENKDYGAELFVNGEIVQRSPERQRRVEPVPQRAQDRPRYNDRTRYVRRRDNMR